MPRIRIRPFGGRDPLVLGSRAPPRRGGRPSWYSRHIWRRAASRFSKFYISQIRPSSARSHGCVPTGIPAQRLPGLTRSPTPSGRRRSLYSKNPCSRPTGVCRGARHKAGPPSCPGPAHGPPRGSCARLGSGGRGGERWVGWLVAWSFYQAGGCFF